MACREIRTKKAEEGGGSEEKTVRVGSRWLLCDESEGLGIAKDIRG